MQASTRWSTAQVFKWSQELLRADLDALQRIDRGLATGNVTYLEPLVLWLTKKTEARLFRRRGFDTNLQLVYILLRSYCSYHVYIETRGHPNPHFLVATKCFFH